MERYVSEDNLYRLSKPLWRRFLLLFLPSAMKLMVALLSLIFSVVAIHQAPSMLIIVCTAPPRQEVITAAPQRVRSSLQLVVHLQPFPCRLWPTTWSILEKRSLPKSAHPMPTPSHLASKRPQPRSRQKELLLLRKDGSYLDPMVSIAILVGLLHLKVMAPL